MGSPGLSSDGQSQHFTTAQQVTGKTIKWVQDTVMLEGHFAKGKLRAQALAGLEELGERKEDP